MKQNTMDRGTLVNTNEMLKPSKNYKQISMNTIDKEKNSFGF